MADFVSYAGIFASAFLAATIIPAQSEASLAVLISAGTYPVILLVGIASIGNTLGAVVNWFLGRSFEGLKSKRWFPVGNDQLSRATDWYQKFGWWSLLLSWAPIIGDPITVASGFFRTPFLLFLIVVAAAKTARYVVVAAITLYLI